MDGILKLSSIALLPVAVSVIFYLLGKKTGFGKFSHRLKQLIYGTVFGILAIIGTEFGVDVGGAVANTRDAAALTAGLVFGGPAGMIAGVIGGAERWLAVFWGAGEYTRLACSLSTVFAGLIGAVLRKYMFDDKKPSVGYALAIGLVTEVLHMLMIFITNISDVETAFAFVEKCAYMMIPVNGIAVMLSVLAVKIIAGEKFFTRKKEKQITTEFQRWLLLCVTVAFLVTGAFTFVLQYQISSNNINSLLELNINDVVEDVNDASDENIIAITKDVIAELEMGKSLDSIAKEKNIAEINLVNKKGIITQSTNSDFVGYDMAMGEQSAEFLIILKGKTEFVQKYQPISYDASISRKYAGVKTTDGFVQVGYDALQFQQDIDKEVVSAARNRHVGKTGFIIVSDKNLVVVSDRNHSETRNLASTGIWLDPQKMEEGTRYSSTVYGDECFIMYKEAEGYYVISVYPKAEAVLVRNLSIYVTIFIEIIVFVGLFILIYFLIKKLVVNNIRKVNSSLSKITGGNLDEVVDVRSNEEFASLSDDINSTVGTLKNYIAEAAARIDRELAFAKSIQHSALPSVFPPYPGRTDMDIYASMHTAKEVGGDFYDFYFVDKDKLAFLIADVSGKGIPAAMFMMTAKTLIKGFAESGKAVNEVFTLANEKLCENNEANMFVTGWLGFIDLKTGVLEFANAGHNPPLIKRADGSFEYLKMRAGFVLAGMEGINYRKNELQLSPGDEIFLYTDGVTEATDLNNELYGEDRLLGILNGGPDKASAQELCEKVKADVDKFVGEAPQFDDITMLSLKYKGGEQIERA